MEHPWIEETLQRSLGESLAHWRIELVKKIDSTSSELMRRGHQLDHQATVLIAQKQTAGRGRSGKPWLSPPRQSIAFSMACTLEPLHWLGLSLACGVAVVKGLSAFLPPSLACSPALSLKWPNDLWAWDERGPAKVGGLLIETQSLRTAPDQKNTTLRSPASQARFCVVGVGINLHTPNTEGLGVVCPPAKGLLDLGARLNSSDERHALLASVLVSLSQALHQFEASGFAPFKADFDRLDCLKGRQVQLSDARRGRALGVNECGELLLDIDGVRQALQAGEISIRPQ